MILRDINIKYEDHPFYKKDQIEVSSEFEQILQEIELVLYTQKGSVLGEEDFGASVEDYLFRMNLDPKSIQRSIKQHLLQEIPELKKFNMRLDVSIEDKASFSMGVINIKITDNTQDPNLTTKLQAIFR